MNELKNLKDYFVSKNIDEIIKLIDDECNYRFMNDNASFANNNAKNKDDFILHLKELFTLEIIEVNKLYQYDNHYSNDKHYSNDNHYSNDKHKDYTRIAIFITFKGGKDIYDKKVNIFFKLNNEKIIDIEEYLFNVFK